MLKKYLILSVLALFGLIIPQTAQAQIKNVSGRILEKHIGNKGRNLPFEEEVHVLAYNTVEAARRELEKLKQPGASAIMAMDYDEEAFPDAQGYYNIRVADSGAIVVFVSQGINALEPVQGRLQTSKLRIVCALHLRVQDRSQRIPDPHEAADPAGILSRQTCMNHNAVLTVIHLPVHFRI